MKHKLNVYFLGQFRLVLDDVYEMNFDDIGSKKNAKLLSYLIKNHNVKLANQEIQNIMFSDDSSNNPGNALKALVYRLRTILKKYFNNVDIVLSGNSTYFINPEIEVILDADEFDKLVSKGNDCNNDEVRFNYYQQAIALYQGSFLSFLNDEQWVMINATYSESSYITVVSYLLKKYLNSEMYSNVEELSTKALEFDPLNESLHYYLIKALKEQGKNNIAKQHYLSTEKLLYDELGIQPSEELQSLYDEIISGQRDKQLSINDVQNHLFERNAIGAFQCSYGTFKKIYQLDARKALRNGISEYLVLLTIEVKDHVNKNSDVVDAVIESTSSLLNQTISKTLRVGDSFAKYSNQQYLILLPDCNDINANNVVNRIIDNFYRLDKYKRVKINSRIDEIKLTGGIDNGIILSSK